jgi:hypothetical protein
MKYFEISYRRTYYWIDKKYVKSELGVTDAVRKTRLKEITNVVEITEEQYKEYKAKQKALKEAKKEREKENFIQV